MVEGLQSDIFLRAGFDAWVLSKPFDIDIIPMERADKKIVEIAKKEGIEL